MLPNLSQLWFSKRFNQTLTSLLIDCVFSFYGWLFLKNLDFWSTIFLFLHYIKLCNFHTQSTAVLFYEPLDLQLVLANRRKCEYSDMLCYTYTCWTTWYCRWKACIAIFTAPCRLLHRKVLMIAPIKHVCLCFFAHVFVGLCVNTYIHTHKFLCEKIICFLAQWYVKFPIYCLQKSYW